MDAKTVEVIKEEVSSSVFVHKLQAYLSTAVPFYLRIYMFVLEEPDANGMPSFTPAFPPLAEPITLTLNPAGGAKFSQGLPQQFLEALAYITARSVTASPDVSSAALPAARACLAAAERRYPADYSAALEALFATSTAPNAHHLVVELEPALPLSIAAPNAAASSPAAAPAPAQRANTFLEVSYFSLQPHLLAPPPSLPPVDSAAAPPADASPLYQAVSGLTLASTKQHVAGGEGLYELLDVYGFTQQQRPPSIVEAGAAAEAAGHGNEVNNVGEPSAPPEGSVAIDMASESLFTRRGESLPPPDCVICMTLPSQAVVLPCRHICMCTSCAQALTEQDQSTKCPMCRERVSDIITL
jgi:hypothetical protein